MLIILCSYVGLSNEDNVFLICVSTKSSILPDKLPKTHKCFCELAELKNKLYYSMFHQILTCYTYCYSYTFNQFTQECFNTCYINSSFY